MAVLPSSNLFNATYFRNYIFLHAIENGLEFPIGTQDAEILDAETGDLDLETAALEFETESDDDEEEVTAPSGNGILSEADYRTRGRRRISRIYDTVQAPLQVGAFLAFRQ